MLLIAALAMQSSFLLSTRGGTADIRWEGNRIFVARSVGAMRATSSREAEAAKPLYLGYPHGPKDAQFVPAGRERESYVVDLPAFKGTISASSDAFACTDDPNAPLGSTYGLAASARSNGVYDREGDWLLTFDEFKGTIRSSKSGFEVESSGPCRVRFRPHYYRDHLGYFLWDKSKPLWKPPVAGWCSWMAHLQDVKEEDMLAAAKFFSANLKDYGYNVIQMDDGYQRVKQFGQDAKGQEPFSSYWTRPNEKFPHGLSWLAQQIHGLGMTPGIWVGDYLPLGLKRAEGYIKDPDGKPHKGPWVNYAVNGLDAAAREEAYIGTVRELKRQGWDYFKIDTLRHVLYDSYRQVPAYWSKRGESMEDAFRAILRETKKAAGNSYVMACWGTLPELAGLVDGARIGEDVGPDIDSMQRSAKYIAQFHSLNNVMWRNDPDYMCLRVPLEQARTWATLTFMAGGHVMVSDPVSVYDPARVDVLRRVGPPLFLRPQNVVALVPDPELSTLAIREGDETRTIAARFGWKDMPARQVPFAELGVPPGRYLAFDFWSENFLGEVTSSLPFQALARGSCQVVSLRPAESRPQVLGTNRHLGQGVVELRDVQWREGVLSGKFLREPGQRWSLFIHVPSGWKVLDSRSAGTTSEQTREVLRLTFADGKGPANFSIRFTR